jgi:hypothetical protein
MSEHQKPIALDAGRARLAVELENAPIAPRLDKSPPPPADPPEDPPRDSDGRPLGDIWEGCPIIPLGVKGSIHYYLDAHGQIIGMGKHAVQDLMSLFGHMLPQLCHHFPVWTRDPDTGDVGRAPGKFNGTAAAMALITACSEKGLFEPDGAVRGPGAWRGSTGQLIWHRGDKLIVDGIERRPGPFDGRIYPAYSPITGPAPAAAHGDPIPEVMATVKSWSWENPETDPTIALGMIGVLRLGGALRWRPTFWMTSAAGGGKSEFQLFIEMLCGGSKGLVKSNDPTKSGITSRLGYGSIPVVLDEIEPGDERSTKERDMIQLARIASSGGSWLRGSADQKGTGGNVYSAFLFSSIIIPGLMKPQDVQRLIRLDLNPLPKGTKPLNLREAEWQARGAVILRLLVDRWPTWDARLSTFRQGLAAQGVTGRDSDNWSTVLAMADMMQREAIADLAEAEAWGAIVAKRLDTSRPDVMTDSEGMLLHLMGRTYDPFRRSEQYNIAQWIMAAADLPGAVESLKDANPPAQLAKAGLRLQGKGAEAKLFIANSASIQPLAELFHGSQWAGGSWSQSARRVEGAEGVPQPLTLAGNRSRGFYIPLAAIPGLASFPMDRAAAAVMPTPTTRPATPSDMGDFV